MNQIYLGTGSRRLVLALIGCLVAGCSPSTVQVSSRGTSQGPPPTTERAKKAAEAEAKLRTKTRLD